jgi:hypothetical protein
MTKPENKSIAIARELQVDKLTKAFAKVRKAEVEIEALMRARGIAEPHAIIHRMDNGPPQCTLYSTEDVFAGKPRRVDGRITRQINRVTVPYGPEVQAAIQRATPRRMQ